MEAVANLKYLRISPRKVKIVLDLIRGKDVGTAAAILMQTPKSASEPVLKLLKSAAANATQMAVNVDAMFVKEILVTSGPTWKRFMPRSQGRATKIHKRTSHITVILAEGQE